MFLHQLDKAVAVTGLEKDKGLALQLGGFDHVFAQVGAAEAVVDKVLQRFGAVKESGLRVIDMLALLPAQHALDLAAFQQGFGPCDQFLHLRSPNRTFLPRERILATKLFMVSENFTPSAADTHSTRVRPFSTPMKSSMENSRVILRRA